MQISTPCHQCYVELLGADPGAGITLEQAPKAMFAELSNNGWYEMQCEQGHRSLVLLHAQRHEILFELGLIALIDGYTRESVANFHAAVERCYEFVIRLLLASKRMNGGMQINNSALEETWKPLSNSTERQFGAYLILYLSKFNLVAPTVSEDQVKFRNQVIHKGFFPTKAEVLIYAEHVYNVMRALMAKMWECDPDAYIDLEGRRLKDARDDAEAQAAKRAEAHKQASKKKAPKKQPVSSQPTTAPAVAEPTEVDQKTAADNSSPELGASERMVSTMTVPLSLTRSGLDQNLSFSQVFLRAHSFRSIFPNGQWGSPPKSAD